ncbi:MAG: hypothetical protein P4L99_01895, partial [Chthoniobacter sp.]|nr:hypothetical protein [Chthoniobacter sp.]
PDLHALFGAATNREDVQLLGKYTRSRNKSQPHNEGKYRQTPLHNLSSGLTNDRFSTLLLVPLYH